MSPTKRIPNWLPGALISILLIGAILYFVDLDDMVNAVRQANYGLLAVSFALSFAWMALRAKVWQTLLRNRPTFVDTFFTVGEDECRAWSIPRGTPAQLAAGEIHSDIARGFIRAEVVGYDSLITRGTMAACRDRGEVRLEGKEYVVQDGDIINFRHAT